MHSLIKFLCIAIAFTCSFISPVAGAEKSLKIPILTYHNFNPTVPGIMTVSPQQFEEQLIWLRENGYNVIPLKVLVNYLQGKSTSLPAKSVVITADDGRNTVYTYMLPLVRKYNIPVTLFIYPSSISRTSYALTWEQLRELKDTGLFDIQGHTFWHPNFKEDQKKLSAADYKKLVQMQLSYSKNILEKKLGITVTLLAWPYGIYDHYLEQEAAKAGYIMAFSVDDRNSNRSENMMAQPRFMVRASYSMKKFAAIINNGKQVK